EHDRHIAVIGATGSGKSTLLYNYALQVLLRNESLIVIDPHGDLALDLLDTIPKNRTNKTVYLDPTAPDRIVGFNPFSRVEEIDRARITAHMISAMKHIWRHSWGPRLEHFLGHAIHLTLATERPTLLTLGRALTSEAYRAQAIPRLTDPAAIQFWLEEYANYPERYNLEAIGPVLNKVGAYLQSRDLRAVVGQEFPRFSLRDSINLRHAVLVNLNRPLLGEEPANILGGTLLANVFSVISERARIPPNERAPVTLVVDEFQTIGSDAFRTMLTEARKFGLRLVLATQSLESLDHDFRSTILTNCGTIVAFRLSPPDARHLAPLMRVEPEDLCDSAPFTAYGFRSFHRFTAPMTLYDKQPLHQGRRDTVSRLSAQRFGLPRPAVERRIAAILKPLK
ncbi:MAG: ATP-binding protein, partial [Hyphomicrobium sp.]